MVYMGCLIKDPRPQGPYVCGREKYRRQIQMSHDAILNFFLTRHLALQCAKCKAPKFKVSSEGPLVLLHNAKCQSSTCFAFGLVPRIKILSTRAETLPWTHRWGSSCSQSIYVAYMPMHIVIKFPQMSRAVNTNKGWVLWVWSKMLR